VRKVEKKEEQKDVMKEERKVEKKEGQMLRKEWSLPG
jgi:hypothetical protein